jgi:S1-C subfamily serine protease
MNIRTLSFALALLVCPPVFGETKPTQPTQPIQPAQSTQPTAADLVEKVSSSIVRVDVTFKYQLQGEASPRLTSSSGTGFVVDSQSRIATADHVVSTAFNQRMLEAQLYAANKTNVVKLILVPGSFRLEALGVSILLHNFETPGMQFYANTTQSVAKVLVQDERLDVAILGCGSNLLKSASVARAFGNATSHEPRILPEFQDDAPRAGDPVTIVGFPAIIMGNQVTQIPGPTTNSGTVSNPFLKDERGRSVILLDLRANHGDSGGPAFNSKDGRVIGFVDEGYAASDGQYSGLTSIIPIRQILNLLPKTEVAEDSRPNTEE